MGIPISSKVDGADARSGALPAGKDIPCDWADKLVNDVLLDGRLSDFSSMLSASVVLFRLDDDDNRDRSSGRGPTGAAGLVNSRRPGKGFDKALASGRSARGRLTGLPRPIAFDRASKTATPKGGGRLPNAPDDDCAGARTLVICALSSRTVSCVGKGVLGVVTRIVMVGASKDFRTRQE
jgi:hypothetical protein